ncbi:hypothetical protein BGZ94_009803, partial [Podila epigama]
NRSDDERPIILEELLCDIERLAQHDFAIKGVQYHPILNALYQRLCDYDVMLKSARKKLERANNAGSPMRAGTAPTPNEGNSASPFDNNGTNRRRSFGPSPGQCQSGSPIPAASSALSTPRFRRVRAFTSSPGPPPALNGIAVPSKVQQIHGVVAADDQSLQHIARLEEKVVDLEQQLALSRRAHHSLLQDHIMNLKATAPLSDQTSHNTVSAQIPAIQTILSHITPIAPASPPPPPPPPLIHQENANDNATTAPGDGQSRLAEQKARLSESMTRSQISLQDVLEQAKQQQAMQLNRLKGITSGASMTGSNSNSNSSSSSSKSSRNGVSDSQQMAIDSQAMVNEAVTRLLRAETELGLLKLVMAQNQEEISGLEEEVFSKQTELNHHRRILESMIESNRLGYVAQIQEDRSEIQKMETTLAKERRETKIKITALEQEVEQLKTTLAQKTKESVDMEMQTKVQALEAEVVQLRAQALEQAEKMRLLEEKAGQAEKEAKADKEALEQMSTRLKQALDHGVEETLDMIDHMEKEHKTKTSVLKANLVKSQKASVRLQNEVSAMALRLVRIQTMNETLEESSERDQAEITRLTKEVIGYKEAMERIQAEMAADQANQSTRHIEGDDGLAQHSMMEDSQRLKEKITALEVQIEEVTSSLRLKELELEQALEETERAVLQLEESEVKLERELAAQKAIHEEEMAKFDQEKKVQAQRERACQAASVTLFQNMVARLQKELSDTQEKLRDTTLSWGHTKEQLLKCDASNRRRRRELEETTKALQEVNETVAHLSDAIELLEKEKQSNMILVQTLARRDQELRDMEFRIKQLEDERE